jgi:hypothetical protein
LAASRTIAQAVRSTRLLAQIFAAVPQIRRTGGDAYALAGRAGQVAASASAAACAFATDAVDALIGFAIARIGAVHTGLFLSTTAGCGAT